MAEKTLGERGDKAVTLGGEGVLPGKRRKKPANEKIALRVAKFCECHEPGAACPEGVQPLNPGFFLLERMRASSGAKSKAKRKVKARSK